MKVILFVYLFVLTYSVEKCVFENDQSSFLFSVLGIVQMQLIMFIASIIVAAGLKLHVTKVVCALQWLQIPPPLFFLLKIQQIFQKQQKKLTK